MDWKSAQQVYCVATIVVSSRLQGKVEASEVDMTIARVVDEVLETYRGDTLNLQQDDQRGRTELERYTRRTAIWRSHDTLRRARRMDQFADVNDPGSRRLALSDLMSLDNTEDRLHCRQRIETFCRYAYGQRLNPPHQAIAFALCRTLNYALEEITGHLSGTPFMDLATRIERDLAQLYRDVFPDEPSVCRFRSLFDPFRAQMSCTVAEAIESQQMCNILERHHPGVLELRVGQTTLNHYYYESEDGERKKSMTIEERRRDLITRWCGRVKERTIAAIALAGEIGS
jgi:hypothetical protein